MPGNEKSRIGRRALLAAGAAGVAAAAVRAVAAPGEVAGADHDPLKIGETNTSSTETILQAPSSTGFSAWSGASDGLAGGSSVADKSGVYGYTSNPNGYGVFGSNQSTGTTGSLGIYGAGVYGLAPAGAHAGVVGECADPNGWGVFGRNTAGGTTCMIATGDNAVLGAAPLDLSHFGLDIYGRVSFQRSGLLTIPANRSSVRTSPRALSATSMVLATLQTNRAGVYVQAAVPNAAAGTITIYLNRRVTAATKVAYFILDKATELDTP